MTKNIYYIEAKIEVWTTLHVLAENKNEAIIRAKQGAWHNIDTRSFDNSKILEIGDVFKGPGVNR
jgi:hypothetical protein